ncbi:MAG: UDP-N-acetylmuramoyl-tripeptide--D-alanyl-D-alanine ligase [Bacteroidaceae bacterium]|nr:UDP-N-acetylmuramoyl-tripeptide--D-alanyl-D-alanine ligase [Prevotellaceae bacterium]MDY5761424.1 UDP-N-acetylmuramoyl-tripeptide--D-alanyl-D-alanine ligase [Bacteroidaceae bacterium]
MEMKELYELFLQHPTITTDSRDVPEGSMFFALKGDTFDGNAYATAALEKGAAYAVIDEKEYAKESHDRLILVEDVLTTLQQLAKYHRVHLGTPIIGITGTNGKTTTKELISAVLKKKYNVLYTQGNFNNHIGVPKTLLQLTKEHDIAVIEMGANHPGEIKTLVEIVLPDFGIITNVGKAHLLGFGSFEGVIRTKGELYDFLRTIQGTVFINNDNPHLLGISNGLKLVKYGQKDAKDLLVKGELVECNPFLKFEWQTSSTLTPQLSTVNCQLSTVQTRLIGSYNLDNALAAACIGTFFNVPATDISAALEEYTPSNNRSQLTITQDNKLVVDAYNANPTSMRAALDNFRLIKAEHKMCILGQMGELGDVSEEEHQKVIDLLGDCGFEKVWLVGENFAKTAHPAHYRLFANVEEVKAAIATEKPQGYLILIKGSNSNKLVQTVELL